jgi:hypothetical protein
VEDSEMPLERGSAGVAELGEGIVFFALVIVVARRCNIGVLRSWGVPGVLVRWRGCCVRGERLGSQRRPRGALMMVATPRAR